MEDFWPPNRKMSTLCCIERGDLHSSDRKWNARLFPDVRFLSAFIAAW